jgi:hypothetical protein
VYFGVLSISQRVERASQGELPVFAGFLGFFLELGKNGDAMLIYI